MSEEELNKEPLTRAQFLWLGSLGSVMAAVLTIPPVVYLLSPSIKHQFGGRSDVPDGWVELGSVFEVPGGEPKVYRVEFPQDQTYDYEPDEGEIVEAVMVTWKDGQVPSVLGGGRRTLSPAETEELSHDLNVKSNACAHLGCPVRWFPDRHQFLCPCHGGIYDINGRVVGGPPPKNLWSYVFEVREDGAIYVKHEFIGGEPWVV
ncbi:hypothetical protein BH18ACT11_BH18ACT11_00180 [soil metagenome]